MNQRYSCLNGMNRVEYAAKPNLPGLDLRRLLFLKLTLMVRYPNRAGAKCPIIVDPIITYTLDIGSVRNARRIWAITPQNRTYRGLKVCIYFLNLL